MIDASERQAIADGFAKIAEGFNSVNRVLEALVEQVKQQGELDGEIAKTLDQLADLAILTSKRVQALEEK